MQTFHTRSRLVPLKMMRRSALLNSDDETGRDREIHGAEGAAKTLRQKDLFPTNLWRVRKSYFYDTEEVIHSQPVVENLSGPVQRHFRYLFVLLGGQFTWNSFPHW